MRDTGQANAEHGVSRVAEQSQGPLPPALAVCEGNLELEAGFPQVQQLIVHLP